MSDSGPQALGVLPKLALALAVLLAVAGVLLYGITWQVLDRIWSSMLERSSGPLSFRFILQPTMAAIAAIHDGLKDARAGRSPYLWSIVRFWTAEHTPGERVARLREGLVATARIILLGIVMDVIYQLVVFNKFYPAEALIIALLLAFVPYLLIRGPATRIACLWRGAASGEIR